MNVRLTIMRLRVPARGALVHNDNFRYQGRVTGRTICGLVYGYRETPHPWSPWMAVVTNEITTCLECIGREAR